MIDEEDRIAFPKLLRVLNHKRPLTLPSKGDLSHFTISAIIAFYKNWAYLLLLIHVVPLGMVQALPIKTSLLK